METRRLLEGKRFFSGAIATNGPGALIVAESSSSLYNERKSLSAPEKATTGEIGIGHHLLLFWTKLDDGWEFQSLLPFVTFSRWTTLYCALPRQAMRDREVLFYTRITFSKGMPSVGNIQGIRIERQCGTWGWGGGLEPSTIPLSITQRHLLSRSLGGFRLTQRFTSTRFPPSLSLCLSRIASRSAHTTKRPAN